MPRFTTGALAALLCLAGAEAGLSQEHPYKLIVNAANPARQAKREQVAALFLNRSARWSHGPAGSAVDQSARSTLREAFSQDVLGKPVVAIQSYWQQRILAAREVPPPVKASDAEVIGHVAKNEGGIGYVGEGTTLPAGVKLLRVVD